MNAPDMGGVGQGEAKNVPQRVIVDPRRHRGNQYHRQTRGLAVFDDPELCPIHNEGFSLSFSSKDGGLVLSPSATGDFANYYRECSISNCEPKNMVAKGVVLGSCSSEEENMFVMPIYSRPTQEIYYKLPSVNRSFDNSAESLGEGVISLSFLSDDEIIVSIHDYDEPGFALWWEDGKFDAEMLGFASLFRRQK